MFALKCGSRELCSGAYAENAYLKLPAAIVEGHERMLSEIGNIQVVKNNNRARLILLYYLLSVTGILNIRGNSYEGKAVLRALDILVPENLAAVFCLPRHAERFPDCRFDEIETGQMVEASFVDGNHVYQMMHSCPELRLGILYFGASRKIAARRSVICDTRGEDFDSRISKPDLKRQINFNAQPKKCLQRIQEIKRVS